MDTGSPVVDRPLNRRTKVKRSADGLSYECEVLCFEGDGTLDLMAGIPVKKVGATSYLACFTLPTQVAVELFAGVAEAAIATEPPPV